MKAFYTAKNYAGKIKKGEIDVKNEREAAGQLRESGYAITSFKEIKEENKGKASLSFLEKFSTIPLSEKMMFARNLGVMISSGLSLSKAIRNIAAQTKNKKFIKVLESVQQDIQGGSSFADGLAKYPSIFNELFVNMIRVGESSGNLEEVLNILAGQLEKEHELISKVKGALVYPAVIVMAMAGIGILMMIFVVPQITSVFKDLNAELPVSTKFIISSSNLLKDHFILVAISFLILLIILKIAFSTKIGKKAIGFAVINVPVIRNIAIKVNCARFARIYSSLLKSGVSVVAALKIISRTLNNFYYHRAFEKAAESIQKGINLSKIISEEKRIFPVLVPQMIEVGEETGKTEVVLMKLAEFYEEDINQLTKNLSSIIEPVLMIIIGSAVGFFAISILQPMYSVLESIK